MKKILKRRETLLIGILVVLSLLVFETKDRSLNQNVFNIANVVKGLRPYLLYSFMTLGTMLVLALGDIDISVGATAALSAGVMVLTFNIFAATMPVPVALTLAIICCLIVGTLCGALNGFLVTRFKELFPMIITLSTQLFYRGLAYLILGGQTTKMATPEGAWSGLGVLYKNIPMVGLKVPIMLIIFTVLAAIFFIWIHITPAGRKIFSVGENIRCARYSGLRTDRVKFMIFALAGLTAAVTGIFFVASNSSSVRADVMEGYEMYAIAAAVLGGFSTSGGKGSVIGAYISLMIFAVMKIGLATLYSFPDSSVNLAVGVVIILTVLVPNLMEDYQKAKKVRRQRAEAAAKAASK